LGRRVGAHGSRAAPYCCVPQAWTSAAWTPGSTRSSSAWMHPPVGRWAAARSSRSGGSCALLGLCARKGCQTPPPLCRLKRPCTASLPPGAPPDYFDPNGQNWGFPTYNWEEMAKDGCLWWRRRLAHMAE
jgi:hypothetical protein